MRSPAFQMVFSIPMLLLSCGAVVAEPLEKATYTDQFLKDVAAISTTMGKQYPPENIAKLTKSDLNGDGYEDLVFFLYEESPPNLRVTPNLAVLYGKAYGEYKLGAISKALCDARIGVNFGIEGQSLLIQALHSMAPSDSIYRFIFRKNELLLSGFDQESYSPDGQDTASGMSVNYLTRQVVYWRYDTNQSKEIKKTLPKAPLIPLNGFDCAEFIPPTGWINESFEFEQRYY